MAKNLDGGSNQQLQSHALIETIALIACFPSGALHRDTDLIYLLCASMPIFLGLCSTLFLLNDSDTKTSGDMVTTCCQHSIRRHATFTRDS